MATKQINRTNGAPVTTGVMTVAELAAVLNDMVARGRGYLPVVTSDCRAVYPFALHVEYCQAGYPTCLQVQPQPHLHMAEREWPMHVAASFVAERNAEADVIRARCGAFA